MFVAFIAASMVVSCGKNSEIDRQLTKAENLMEQHPDSSMAILSGMDRAKLGSDRVRARYALLMSMALDKNYIDTTTFDVLQPAIDYYLDKGKGTADDKLRTYYYQGRIYQNKVDRDNAIKSFAMALDNTYGVKDSLCIARTLVAQAGVYHDFYDFESYMTNHLRAAIIYKDNSYRDYEFDCLLNALNGAILLSDKAIADSVLNLCNTFNALNENDQRRLNGHRLSFVINFGTKDDLAKLLNEHNLKTDNDVNGLLNLALAYNKLGENIKAKHYLDSVYESRIDFDSLKYMAISVTVLRDLKDFESAFLITGIIFI